MKRIICILLAAMPLLAMAQGRTSVKLDEAGQLASKILEDDRFKITELKVSGPMNGADIKLMQQIVNRTKAKEKNGECLVKSVDLSEAIIIEGKDGMKTKANELPSGLFAGAKEIAMNSIDLPAALLSIGDDAFEKCTSLAEIKIPVAVTSIGSDAFYECSMLTRVELSAALKKIGGSAFQKCPMLREVVLNCPTPPSISKSTFKDVAATFLIPAGSKPLYNNDKDWQKLPTKEKTTF